MISLLTWKRVLPLFKNFKARKFINRADKFQVKAIYQRTNRKSPWDTIDGVNYTTNINDILQDDEIDVVVVCTSTDSHYDVAKQVLLAGKNCVVEKPFATSYEKAKELFAIAEEMIYQSIMVP